MRLEHQMIGPKCNLAGAYQLLDCSSQTRKVFFGQLQRFKDYSGFRRLVISRKDKF